MEKETLLKNALKRKAVEHIVAQKISEAALLIPELEPYSAQDHEAANIIGSILWAQGHIDASGVYFQRSTDVNPNYPDAISNLANVYYRRGELDKARTLYSRVIEIRPEFAPAWNNLGAIDKAQNNLEEATKKFLKAVELNPSYGDAYNNLGASYRSLNKPDQALKAYEEGLRHAPRHPQILRNRGNLLKDDLKFEQAISDYQKALDVLPSYSFLLGDLIHLKASICDWSGWEDLSKKINDGFRTHQPVCPPFPSLAITDDPEVQRQQIKLFVEEQLPFTYETTLKEQANNKIKLGYFSSDFFDHATMKLLLKAIQAHDRDQFELHAFCYTKYRDKETQDIQPSFDAFHDVHSLTDTEIIQKALLLNLDIAIDLKGYTKDSRPGIFRARLAKCQISYLGFPGTTCNSKLDYIICDKHLIPEGDERFYSEKPLYLDCCYQPNDRDKYKQVAKESKKLTRKSVGLPPKGFVFGSFNNNYKLHPELLDLWLEIFQATPGSILWTFTDNDEAKRNFTREWLKRGLDKNRLVFASRIPHYEHLSRHRFVDVMLDTFPCNGHTTAGDCLALGVPLVTLRGRSFAGRVSSSLLHHFNARELIAESKDDYKTIALSLHADKAKLQRLRKLLLTGLEKAENFIPAVYIRHFEQALRYALEETRSAETKTFDHPSKISVGSAKTLSKGECLSVINTLSDLESESDPTRRLYLCSQILQKEPNNLQALHAYAFANFALGHHDKTLEVCTTSLAYEPNQVALLNLKGFIYFNQGNLQAAEECFAASVRIDETPEALLNYGTTLSKLNKHEVAIEKICKAIRLNPTYSDAYNNLGEIHMSLGHFDLSLDLLKKSLSLNKKNVNTLFNLANLHRQTNDFELALKWYKRVLSLSPNHVGSLNNLGFIYYRQKNWTDAKGYFLRVCELEPSNTDYATNLIECLRQTGELQLALERALTLVNSGVKSHKLLLAIGNIYKDLKDNARSADFYQSAYELNSTDSGIVSSALHSQMLICRWEHFSDHIETIENFLQRSTRFITPFPTLSLIDSPKFHQSIARRFFERNHSHLVQVDDLPKTPPKHRKLRLGYFSADYWTHPVALLSAGLFECHDRERFEVYAFSYSPHKPNDPMRLRLERGFDRFIDIREMSDHQVVSLARELEIDIAFDLSGYTLGARTEIFAMRCAPLQINYLGYPGTMGSNCYDYIVVDSVVAPCGAEEFYNESLIRLSGCYQPNDGSRVALEGPLRRDQAGLPETGFIFCCFNNNYKILPFVFERWMKILDAVSGSVLWLLQDNSVAAKNLKNQALEHGVDPDRIIFAPRAPLNSHLQRYQLADLFLDTYPYNAHTTASDSLWCGVPVLTLMGESFPSRVAASILTAAGHPEFITQNLDDYQARAIEYATSGQHRKINVRDSALFDIKVYTKNFEECLLEAWANSR